MHPVLFYESLFFCSRDDLERLQPLSQWLLNMIVNGSNVLPLRPIDRVEMDCYYPKDTIEILVEDNGQQWPDYKASILDGNFEETFLRLQHTCVKYFDIGIRESPFLSYWMAQEAASFTVVSIDLGPPETMDYDILDSIVNHLRPRTTTEVDVNDASWREDNSEYLAVLARDSFLNNLQICRLIVQGDAFPPPFFMFSEPGYANYEMWIDHTNMADGIDCFIESFVRDGCANKKLESVYIKCDESSNHPPPAPKQLVKPTKIDMPLPKIDLNLIAPPTRYDRVSQCEVHSFVNSTQWKRLDLYKWRAEYVSSSGRRLTTHVLQCRVKNL